MNNRNKEGIVAFFDILGYQNIINNNKIEAVAEIINNIIIGLPENAIKKSKWFKDYTEHFPDGHPLKPLQIRIISDGIIIVYPVNFDLPEDWMFTYHVWLLGKYCEALLYYSFEEGLPLRGAIDCGEFFLNESCFAGKPLVNCYQLAMKLDFSGCILTKELNEKFHRIRDKETKLVYSRDLGFEYLCPLNDRTFEKLFTIAWCEKIKEIPDLKEYSFNAFQKHNKDIDDKALNKLQNTELWLRKRKVWAEKYSSPDDYRRE